MFVPLTVKTPAAPTPTLAMIVPADVLPSPQVIVVVSSAAVPPGSASLKVATAPVNHTFSVAATLTPVADNDRVLHRGRREPAEVAAASVTSVAPPSVAASLSALGDRHRHRVICPLRHRCACRSP